MEIKSFKVTVERSDSSIVCNEVSFKVATPVDVIRIYREMRFHYPEIEEGDLIERLLALIRKDGIVYIATAGKRIVATMGFEYLSLLNDKRNDCMSSMWLTVHQGYVDHFLQMVLLNMARKKVDAENMMIKLNPKTAFLK